MRGMPSAPPKSRSKAPLFVYKLSANVSIFTGISVC